MEDLTGRQFGPYQIVSSLGEGGMAAVYKAYQPSMDRYVAIKVLPRQFAESDEFQARFRREAKMLAQLQHTHILPVFDFGEADGYPYIVMTYVEGGTLANLMHTKRLSLTEIVKYVSQVGDALAYAHERGMVHRDVKPSNILMDPRGNCLLTDFGLARMTTAVSSKLTSSGTVMGTPAYMSPEQGVGNEIDHRSDIYSLGVIFYEMLANRVPYTADTPVGIVFKHVQEPLPPLKTFGVSVPVEVEAVLNKALAKKPENRYQTAEDFVNALQRIVSSSAFTAPMPAPSETLRADVPPSASQPSIHKSGVTKPGVSKTWIAVSIVLAAVCLLGGVFACLVAYSQNPAGIFNPPANQTQTFVPSTSAPSHTPAPTTISFTSTPAATLTSTPEKIGAVGDIVQNASYEVTVLEARELKRVYMGNYYWYPENGKTFVELVVKISNLTGSGLSIPWKDVVLTEDDNEEKHPLWGGYKETRRGRAVDGATIGVNDTKDGVLTIDFKEDVSIRAIWYVDKSGRTSFLFRFDDAPSIKVVIQ